MKRFVGIHMIMVVLILFQINIHVQVRPVQEIDLDP